MTQLADIAESTEKHLIYPVRETGKLEEEFFLKATTITTSMTVITTPELVRFKEMENIQKEWWVDLHTRHKFRIYTSLILTAIGIMDFVLSAFGLGYWDMYLDFLWVIGAFGLLGASTYIAIDSGGE